MSEEKLIKLNLISEGSPIRNIGGLVLGGIVKSVNRDSIFVASERGTLEIKEEAFRDYKLVSQDSRGVLCPDYIPEDDVRGICRFDGSNVTKEYCRDVVGLNYGHCPLENN